MLLTGVPFSERTLEIYNLFDLLDEGPIDDLFDDDFYGGDDYIEQWCLTAEDASRDAKLFVRRCLPELEYKQKWSQIETPFFENGIEYSGKIRLGPGSYRPLYPPGNNSTIFRPWPENSEAMCLTYGGRNVFLQGCQNAYDWVQMNMLSISISTIKSNGKLFDLGYDPLRKFSKLRLFYNERLTNPSVTQWRLRSIDIIDVNTIAFPPRFTNHPTPAPV